LLRNANIFEYTIEPSMKFNRRQHRSGFIPCSSWYPFCHL